jgi:hypothetical protein
MQCHRHIRTCFVTEFVFTVILFAQSNPVALYHNIAAQIAMRWLTSLIPHIDWRDFADWRFALLYELFALSA